MMAENKTTGYNRAIRVSGVPGGTMPEITIAIPYRDFDDGKTADRAVVLDSIIIPAILKALNQNQE